MSDQKKAELLAIHDIIGSCKREAMALRCAIAGLAAIYLEKDLCGAVEERALSLIDNIQDLSDKMDYLRGEDSE